MKRIVLFLLTNIAVVAVLGVVASLLGVNRYLTANGLDLTNLLGFALIMGFGGSIISLLMSKMIAKMSMSVQIIGAPRNADEAWIVETVRELAGKAGIQMPEVGIYEGAPNAFATGAFKNSALVAVSTGLLAGMTRDEVRAVLGHEIAHVANGDMVTMTLIQGVMNTFVVFASRAIGYLVDSFLRRGDDRNSGPGVGYMVTTLVLDIVFGFVAAIIVAWFSRQREFRADAGSAQLLGQTQPMINALYRLGGMTPGEMPKSLQAMGIAGGIGKLFSSHPPIEQRVEALKALRG
ncbi:MAG: zinc metalloprotease HtpX [Burkholderiales bacterium 66-5]|jgi:heat shock protein HtpX|uniref:protease HtpX n=1 Tax=Comamonas badia TaxID=265291 RepID=UPI00040EEF57|nr:protease HtpX [Comamonas badia]OJU86849.1 MAG: zinc metalloprotease HtpX [Burkholderiales bacterium 66-5]